MDQHQNQIETFEAFDDCENIGSNPAPDSPIGEIIEARYGRRALAILTISDHLLTHEALPSDQRERSFGDMVEIALKAAFA